MPLSVIEMTSALLRSVAYTVKLCIRAAKVAKDAEDSRVQRESIPTLYRPNNHYIYNQLVKIEGLSSRNLRNPLYD